jgi:hypothetical protein
LVPGILFRFVREESRLEALVVLSAERTVEASSRGEPMSLVNIELHRAVVTHLQQERLAIVLMLYVHTLHDFESLQRLFAKSSQNLFSISHWGSLRRYR